VAARVYSTRLIFRSGVAGSSQYVVGLGRRVVIKHVTTYNPNASVANVSLSLNSVGIWATSLPVAPGSEAVELFVVCNAGDTISAFTGKDGVGMVVSGYDFSAVG
jgi:hypothetical protein